MAYEARVFAHYHFLRWRTRVQSVATARERPSGETFAKLRDRLDYLCVVTAGDDTGDRFVVTAYFTKNIKQGNQLWTK